MSATIVLVTAACTGGSNNVQEEYPDMIDATNHDDINQDRVTFVHEYIPGANPNRPIRDLPRRNFDDIELLREKYLEIFDASEEQIEAFVSLWRESEFLFGLDWFTIVFATEDEISKGFHREWGGMTRNSRLVFLDGELLGEPHSLSELIDYYCSSDELQEIIRMFENERAFFRINVRRMFAPREPITITLGINPELTEFFYEIRPDAMPDQTSAFQLQAVGVRVPEDPFRFNLRNGWQVLVPIYEESW